MKKYKHSGEKIKKLTELKERRKNNPLFDPVIHEKMKKVSIAEFIEMLAASKKSIQDTVARMQERNKRAGF